MCTVALCFRAFAARPVVLVANRDEALDRPAAGPALWDGSPSILAPRDTQAGGTWLGLNEFGVVVAITNRFGLRDATRRSRGELVVAALQARSSRDAIRAIERMSATNYNGFHLFVADAAEAFRIVGDGSQQSMLQLDPGVHVATERSFGADDDRREHWVRQDLEKLLDEDRPLELLLSPLRTHRDSQGNVVTAFEDASPVTSSCVHWPALRYGTRSSSAIELGSRPRFLHAEGPTCVSEHREISEIDALGRGIRG